MKIFPDFPKASKADIEFHAFGCDRDCRAFLAKQPVIRLVKRAILVEVEHPGGPRPAILNNLVVRLMKLERQALDKRIHTYLAAKR